MLYDFDDTEAVMRWYRELQPSLPEELNGWIGLLTIPPAPPFPEELWGRKACGIVWCYTGPGSTRRTRSWRRCGSSATPCSSGSARCRSRRCRARSTRSTLPGLQWYWKADFFDEISDEGIDIHKEYGAQLPSGHSTMHLYPIDGCASRVPEEATAFAYRRGGWAGVIVGVDPDPGERERAGRAGRAATGRRCTRRRRVVRT